MSGRKVETIEHHEQKDEEKAIVETANEVPLVHVHYPSPTLLSVILSHVSEWSGQNFVMDPRVNPRLQIIAPHPLPPEDAFDLVMQSLSIVGLRAVVVGTATKIVPVEAVRSA